MLAVSDVDSDDPFAAGLKLRPDPADGLESALEAMRDVRGIDAEKHERRQVLHSTKGRVYRTDHA
jgi:hypothetical protein